jgi:hypothetical protein
MSFFFISMSMTEPKKIIGKAGSNTKIKQKAYDLNRIVFTCDNHTNYGNLRWRKQGKWKNRE